MSLNLICLITILNNDETVEHIHVIKVNKAHGEGLRMLEALERDCEEHLERPNRDLIRFIFTHY